MRIDVNERGDRVLSFSSISLASDSQHAFLVDFTTLPYHTPLPSAVLQTAEEFLLMFSDSRLLYHVYATAKGRQTRQRR